VKKKKGFLDFSQVEPFQKIMVSPFPGFPTYQNRDAGRERRKGRHRPGPLSL
jgi:hypothetical protein